MNALYYFVILMTMFVVFYYLLDRGRNAFLLQRKLDLIYNNGAKNSPGHDSDGKHGNSSRFHGLLAKFVKDDDNNSSKSERYFTLHSAIIAGAATLFSSVIWLLLIIYSYAELSTGGLIYFLATCCAAGYSIKLYLRRRSLIRLKKISAAFPDVLELLSICTGAGLSIDASIHRLSEDLGTIYPEISRELDILSNEINVLPNKKIAYQNFCDRTEIPYASDIFNSVFQAEQLGSSLSMLFRNYTDTIRKEKILLIEERSAKLPTLLTIPMILFILPVLFVVLLGPAVVSISDNLLPG